MTESTYNLEIAVPKITDRIYNQPLLCGPGPANYWSAINDALIKPIVTPIDDEYYFILEDISEGLRYLFQTRSKLVLAVSGSGHAGMETVISNLVGPGETLLIAARGIWDDRACNMAQRYGIKTVQHKIPMHSTFTLEELEPLLKQHRPKALFITHGDSSTGTVQRLEGLGDLCHKYGSLLIVDTVVSLGAVPFLMDKWGVDAVYSAAQKALSGPPGIAPVAFSPRAEAVIKSRKHLPPFYFDVELLAQQWNCYGNTRVYHHTMSSPIIWALRRCLQEICHETLPAVWARHDATKRRFIERLQKMPVKFLVPKYEDRLATVTTIIVPDWCDQMDIVKHVKSKHNILIMRGLGPTVGVAMRLGLMGVNSTIETADKLADALEDALNTLSRVKNKL